MIAIPAGVRILMATEPVDFRKGFDGLAALVQQRLQADVFAGDVFVFRARRSDRLKLLLWDGSGLVLISKRLEQGGFTWPPVRDGVVRLTPTELAVLLQGLDWSRVGPKPVRRPTAAC